MANQPHVSYTFTDSGAEYLRTLINCGALEGPVGSQCMNPKLAAVLEAAHHVLAGGEVTISVSRAGDKSTVEKLDHLLTRSTSDANAANGAGGGPIIMMP